MRTKILPIILPPTLYRKLELDGRAAERDVVQQARWILKRALSASPSETNDSTSTLPAA